IFYIENFYSRDEGAIFKAYHPNKKGVNVYINSCNIKNVTQESELYSASLITTTSGKFTINGLTLTNVDGNKSGCGYFKYVECHNKNLKTRYAEPIFNSRTNGTCSYRNNHNQNHNYYPSFKIENLKLQDVYEIGGNIIFSIIL
ncbi:hypothetical protein PIROE2DRAFT_5733, partial [Piromyces sp. E2]